MIAGVDFARENALELAVRGGAHNVAGRAARDGAGRAHRRARIPRRAGRAVPGGAAREDGLRNRLDELTDEAIATFVEHGSAMPNIFSGIHLYPIDGVAGRVAADETAFGYRGSRWSEVIYAADPDPSTADALRA